MPPLWLVALIVAAAAPFCAAALQVVLESRLRRRTSTMLASGRGALDRAPGAHEEALDEAQK